MGREGAPTARSNLPSGNRTRSDCLTVSDSHEQEKLPPDFFVPSFSVYRPVLATEEMIDFHGQLESLFDRLPYKVQPLGSMAIRLLEQHQLIGVFRDANVEAYADEMHDVSDGVKKGLQQQVKGQPKELKMPTGGLYPFGNRNKSVGIVPGGWKGFKARYADTDKKGNPIFNSRIVSETSLIVGALAQMYASEYEKDDEMVENDELTEVDMRPLFARTPHLKVARKTRGRKISSKEVSELNGQIGEIMPSEIPLFDPIIQLRLDRDKEGFYHDPLGRRVNYKNLIRLRNPEEYGRLLHGNLDDNGH
ncbi:MAG: hypothetical protein U5L95_02810 [Candidatus Saccharibacteria bacterium]|nr:hypothetical protein [Candidatus Saccharibacteria bacterium]